MHLRAIVPVLVRVHILTEFVVRLHRGRRVDHPHARLVHLRPEHSLLLVLVAKGSALHLPTGLLEPKLGQALLLQ